MPASLFHESDPGSGQAGLEDQRALQLALELSMLGLSNDADALSFDPESRGKKSQNTTECVPVPSSEHVAEIVGRQGCKIKALRAKTNTYIKTPVRGEEPVFVVTGRKEDVSSAKREILSAAEHFSQIRAQRKNNLTGSLGPGPNPNIPGQTTIQVRVPYRVVGLVVGPKGATIKRIQQQTNTYIITPSRDKEPIFEVTGLPESVETAKKEIEAHIAMRTGGVIGDNGVLEPSEAHQTASLADSFGRSSPLFKTSSDAFASFSSTTRDSLFPRSSQDIFSFGSKFSDLYSSFGSSFSNVPGPSFSGLYESDEGLGDSPTFTDSLVSSSGSNSAWPDFSAGSKAFTAASLLERRGSNLGSEANSTSSTSSSGTTSSTSPTEAADGPESLNSSRRMSNDPLTSAFVNAVTSAALGFSGLSGSTTTSSSPTESLTSLGSLGGTNGRKNVPKRDCIICFEGEIQAALIPCGHNLFCMDCALRVCRKTEPSCPVCHQSATQAIRIIS